MHWKQQAIYAGIIVLGLVFIGAIVASIHRKTPNGEMDVAVDEHFRNQGYRLPKIPKSQRKRREGEGWWVNPEEYPTRCQFTKEDAECRSQWCTKHNKKEDV